MGRYVKADISTGVYKALSDIQRYDAATQTEIYGAVQDKTKEVYTQAVQLAPSKAGNLKASIKYNVNRSQSGIAGTVYTKDPVAHLVEFGARSAVEIPIRKKALHPGAAGWFMAKATIPRRSPHPFMKPAMDTVRPSIESAIKEAVIKHAD